VRWLRDWWRFRVNKEEMTLEEAVQRLRRLQQGGR
jgi:hypothetical protein